MEEKNILALIVIAWLLGMIFFIAWLAILIAK